MSDEYIPFGDEWVKEFKKFPKDEIIAILQEMKIKEANSIKYEVVTVFHTFNDWVNNASKRLGGIKKHSTMFCLDKNGFDCFMGQQFMYARDNDRFPVTAYRLIKNTDKSK